MYYLRTTKTGSGATAVQIVRYENRKKIIVVHVGSAHHHQELLSLKQTALDWIETNSKQQKLAIFPEEDSSSDLLIPIGKCCYLGVNHYFVYETLKQILVLFKFRHW